MTKLFPVYEKCSQYRWRGIQQQVSPVNQESGRCPSRICLLWFYGFYSNFFGNKEDLPYGLSCLCDNKMSFSWALGVNFFAYYLRIYDRIDFLYGLSWSWESHRCLLSWMLVINFFPHSLQINFSSPTCWRMWRLSPSSCSYVLGHHWHLERNENGTEFVSNPDQIPDCFKAQLLLGYVHHCQKPSAAYYEHLSNKWLSLFEISAVQLSSGTEIVPK